LGSIGGAWRRTFRVVAGSGKRGVPVARCQIQKVLAGIEIPRVAHNLNGRSDHGMVPLSSRRALPARLDRGKSARTTGLARRQPANRGKRRPVTARSSKSFAACRGTTLCFNAPRSTRNGTQVHQSSSNGADRVPLLSPSSTCRPQPAFMIFSSGAAYTPPSLE